MNAPRRALVGLMIFLLLVSAASRVYFQASWAWAAPLMAPAVAAFVLPFDLLNDGSLWAFLLPFWLPVFALGVWAFARWNAAALYSYIVAVFALVLLGEGVAHVWLLSE